MTIPPKKKKCKANYKAEGATGCGKEVYKRTYGLCDSCYSDWLLNTPAGKSKREKAILSATKERKEVDKATKEKKERQSMAYLRNNVKNVCHEYIRERDKGRACISCGAPWKPNFQAGHWFKSELYSNLRYDERNIHGQCEKCNLFLNGNHERYSERVSQRIGVHGKAAIEEKAKKFKHESWKWDAAKLRSIRTYYREKLKGLEKRS